MILFDDTFAVDQDPYIGKGGGIYKSQSKTWETAVICTNDNSQGELPLLVIEHSVDVAGHFTPA
jgi:hypothetical protein